MAKTIQELRLKEHKIIRDIDRKRIGYQRDEVSVFWLGTCGCSGCYRRI